MKERENMDDNLENDSPKRPKKHLLYRIFNPEGSGKEAKPIPDGPDNLKKCFRIYGRNVTNLLYINLIKIIGNFPILFALFALMGGADDLTTAASSGMFSQLHGVMLHSNSPVALALFGVHGGQSTQRVMTTTTYVLLGLSLLVLFTFGIINTGTSYLLRGIVRGDPLFFWSDFKGAIKRNIKQGMIIGVIDTLLLALLIYDFYFFYINQSMMFYIMIVVFAFYMMARYYIYPLLITFDLSIWKIFKNAFIFSMLGFRRNILAFLGFVLIMGLEIFLFMAFLPLGIIFPLIVMFSSIAYFGTFAAWPKIKEIMIDPYVKSGK